MKVTKKKLKDYLQDAKNFNRGTEYGDGLITKSVDKFGAGRSMLASSDGVLIAGNKSHQALADAGIENVIEIETDGKTAVVVKRTDIKSGTKKFHELALADNATSKANLNFDETLVEEILTEEVMLEWGVGNPKAEEDDYTPPPLEEIKTDIVKGDIFEITDGKLTHRLLCGDSTVKEDVEKLMNGQKADMVFTDPPYGVNIVPTAGWSKGKIGASNLAKTKVYNPIIGDDKPFDPKFLIELGVNQIIFGGNYFANNLPSSSCWIIWDKREGMTSNSFADCEIAWTSFDKPARVYHHLWSGMIRKGDREIEGKERSHPTQKPVGLFGNILTDFSKPNEIVIDPFLGSGTTMVAGHQLGRNVYGIEIMPAYCQIIIDRMAKLDNSLKFTRNGKPYKITPINASDIETGKAPTKGTSLKTAPKEAEIQA